MEMSHNDPQNIEYLSKEPIDIFEEIVNLLSITEAQTENHPWHPEAIKGICTVDPVIEHSTNHEHNLDVPTDGILNLNNLYEPPLEPPTHQQSAQLYTVSNGELLPIASLVTTSGIYRKLQSSDNDLPKESTNVSNVVFSGGESNGRIISKTDFLKLYALSSAKPDEEVEVFTEAHAQKMDMEDNESSTSDAAANRWDPLSKLAYNIFKLANRDHIVIDRKRYEIVRTEYGTHQKTIYRMMSPQSFQLELPQNEKAADLSSEAKPTTEVHKRRHGRPRKMSQDMNSKNAKLTPKENEIKTPNDPGIEQPIEKPKEIRTRSGRVVKVVKPMYPTALSQPELAERVETPAQYLRNFIAELRDSDYYARKIFETPPASDQATTSPSSENKLQAPKANSTPPPKRRVPPESICPTCHKIFLGRRMQRHFIKQPDHMKIVPTSSTTVNSDDPPKLSPTRTNDCTTPVDEISLFRFLVSKLQKANLNEDQKADLFLAEINDFVEQLQARSSRLIRNTSGLHFVTARSARVLGIPEGQYALDMSAIEAPMPDPEPDNSGMNGFEGATTIPAPLISIRSLDYTAISMDNTLTDEAVQKLNLTAGGKLLPPSEETLLRVVEDLVPDAMAKLTASSLRIQHENDTEATKVETMIPNYEHANDNAVEAVTLKETSTNGTQQAKPLLDLSVDFFQFNKNLSPKSRDHD